MFKEYIRTNVAEMREATKNETLIENGSPKIGDMIVRNPENHKNQWLVAKDYFDVNFTLKG